ncbi:MAG: hypothetical protein ACK4JY_02290 [Brevundimonas sp.]|uniref:hypothetical protein n=1 Tax=Brevundimonas sp. TaxID=1871086 RepID=UPI00391A0163
MTTAGLKSFVRSFTWKEWLALSVITALHVAAGSDFGVFAMAFQLLLGVCVGLVVIGGWRILSKADKRGPNPPR